MTGFCRQPLGQEGPIVRAGPTWGWLLAGVVIVLADRGLEELDQVA
jgi:hypothetical protein